MIVRAPAADAVATATDDMPSRDASPAVPTPSARIAKAGASRASCTECGTITSIREVTGIADATRQEISDARRDHGGIVASSTQAFEAADADTPAYEITVRFRDGRKSVFVEPGPPTWRVGSRIVLIAGASPKAN